MKRYCLLVSALLIAVLLSTLAFADAPLNPSPGADAEYDLLQALFQYSTADTTIQQLIAYSDNNGLFYTQQIESNDEGTSVVFKIAAKSKVSWQKNAALGDYIIATFNAGTDALQSLVYYNIAAYVNDKYGDHMACWHRQDSNTFPAGYSVFRTPTDPKDETNYIQNRYTLCESSTEALEIVLNNAAVTPTAQPTLKPTPSPTSQPTPDPDHLVQQLAQERYKNEGYPSYVYNRPFDPLKRGDKGEYVKELQLDLIFAGFLEGKADGDYGAKTEAAVKAYQKKRGTAETGEADTSTQIGLCNHVHSLGGYDGGEDRDLRKGESSSSSNSSSSKVVTYVINTKTRKFHYPDCPSVSQMSAHNRAETSATRDQLIKQGYQPCGRCCP